ncbi:FAD-binding oxidoreductase [Vandammella animalimorsus]|uniref:FAD-binding oxidoreductase n=1 Tax=Vandammella animalimorsus TaxID=2029117 RepID=A0A3M6RR85_9BURK|nr:FAD-binding oxidoreductase [Vandammella animalimorsus]RMX17521.1 FAD-binding oxidoreductase [Vandammella animalimorsus]
MSGSTRIGSDVIVIGGGIMGCATALFLRQRHRLRVTLLERDVCGARASGINFGGVRRQGRAIVQLPLAQRSQQLWGRLRSLIGTDGEYERSGHFKMAFTDAHMQALAEYAQRSKDYGLNLQLIEGRRALEKHFPAVGARIVGGSLCPEDGQANPRLVAPAFAQAARRHGVDVREHTSACAVEHDGQRFIVHAAPTQRTAQPEAAAAPSLRACAPVLVNCAGAWAAPFAAQWGEAVPMHTIAPAMGVTEPLPFFLPWSLGVEGGSIYLRQVRRGNIVFGGGRGHLFPSPDTPRPQDCHAPSQPPEHARTTQSALLAQMARLSALLPQLAHAQLIRTWSGSEGSLPDDQPILGPSLRRPGLYHAFGFCGAGFQLGPGVGEALAELIAQGRTDTPLNAFAINRFCTSGAAQPRTTHEGDTP